MQIPLIMYNAICYMSAPSPHVIIQDFPSTTLKFNVSPSSSFLAGFGTFQVTPSTSFPFLSPFSFPFPLPILMIANHTIMF